MDLSALPAQMVTIAASRNPSEVPVAVVHELAQCPMVSLVRIWLLQAGDQCASCRWANSCEDKSTCLHLVASDGNPLNKKTDVTGLRDGFVRYPLSMAHLGHVAVTGKPFGVVGLTGKEDWIVDQAWAKREKIHTFAAQPLRYRGEVLGVLEMFDRHRHDDEHFQWLRIFADHVAVSLANARAFAEVEDLQQRIAAENDYLQTEMRESLAFDDIVGRAPTLQRVLEQVALVAPTDANVLVLGESGVGKELVARVIHDRSPRRARPLIKVNCSSIPEALFESEMFGHVKGAFSGAVRDRRGRFQLADGGTLLLDEIGEMPLNTQSKLLRVLQEKEFERVGDDRTQQVDVRIVAATNRDLAKEVAAGRFREDLYYRLSVFPVEVPPLRDRHEDIPDLAIYFARRAAQRMGLAPPRISRAESDRLQRYEWPGNVRELQNVVERALILAQSRPLRFADLLPATESKTTQPAPLLVATDSPHSPVLTRTELKRIEREQIIAALKQTHGRVHGTGGAAELLAMKPTTLSSRLKALNISAHRFKG